MTPKTKYAKLVNLFSDYRKQQFGLLLLCAVGVLLNILLIYRIQGIIDCVVEQSPMQVFAKRLAEILLLALVTLAAAILQNVCWHYFRNILVNRMRLLLYRGMMKKSAVFFDSHSTGDIVSAVLNDGSGIAENVGIGVLMLVLNILHVTVVVGLFFYMNAPLGVLVTAVSFLYYVLMVKVNGRMRSAFRRQQQELANVNQSLTEKIRAAWDIIVLDKKEYFEKKFGDQLWVRFFKEVKRVIRVQVESEALGAVMKVIFPVAVVAGSAFFVYQGQISVGSLVVFYTLVQNIVEPLNNLGDYYRGRQQALGAAERVYDYLFADEAPDGMLALPEKVHKLDIRVNSFSWREKKVLQRLSLSAEGGDFVFIRGESGCGKSTLLKLVSRLYGLEDGEIRVNGKNISEYSSHAYYQKLQMLFQEPFIYEGTVRENLTLGEARTEEEIAIALRLTCMEEFVDRHGLDYQLEENGKNLSGGQKQRLCLARVLLRKPDILLLDEATSALNRELEQDILEGLARYVKENSCIVLAVSHSGAYEAFSSQIWDLGRIMNIPGGVDKS